MDDPGDGEAAAPRELLLQQGVPLQVGLHVQVRRWRVLTHFGLTPSPSISKQTVLGHGLAYAGSMIRSEKEDADGESPDDGTESSDRLRGSQGARRIQTGRGARLRSG